MGILDKIMGKESAKETVVSGGREKAAGAKIRAEMKKAKPESARKKNLEKKEKAAQPKKESRSGKVSKKEENFAHRILLEPLVTEKSTELNQLNKYVFKVNPNSGKREIKSAIEDYYGVGVVKVNIVKIFPKKRIHGRTIGWKQGYKKAIITLREGDTIGAVEGV